MDLLTSVDPTSGQSSADDPFHPSFFELAAQAQLQDLIKPAFRYVLAVLAQRNPRYLLRAVNNFDELYAIVMAGIETHYLRVWGASFSENFYGLKRRRRPALSTSRAQASSTATSVSLAASERLTKREIRASLFFLVALPYLGAKLEDLWERNGGGVTSSSNLFGDDDGASTRFTETSAQLGRVQRARQWALALVRVGFPYAKTLYQLWLLTYNVRYLFGKTPYWRPWLHLMRVDVRRVGPNDGPRLPLTPRKFPSISRQPLKAIAKALSLAPGVVYEALKYGLPASIFFFKFLEWWYGADNPRRRNPRASTGTSGGAGDSNETHSQALDSPAPLPPHPKGILATNLSQCALTESLPNYKLPHIYTLSAHLVDKLTEDDADNVAKLPSAKPTLLDTDKQQGVTRRRLVHNSCPLCGALPINNPAVLPTGYVFCYTCIYSFLENRPVCPVTLTSIPDGKHGLRKVLG